jgi:hypothetical protein
MTLPRRRNSIPTPGQAYRELRIHGSGPIGKWLGVIGAIQTLVHAHDRRARVKLWALRGLRGFLVAVPAIGFVVHEFNRTAGIGLIMAGWLTTALAYWFRPRDGSIGSERLRFVRHLLKTLAAKVPDAWVRLTARLDVRAAFPVVADPGVGFGENGNTREDAWLRGTLQGVRGLRVSWRCTEWRTVRIREWRNDKGNRKWRGKAKLVTRMVVRLDADRALFRPALEGVAPRPNETFDLRRGRRGYVVRGWREPVAKAMIEKPTRSFHGALRESKDIRVLGAPCEDLLELMIRCERWLAPRGLGGGKG